MRKHNSKKTKLKKKNGRPDNSSRNELKPTTGSITRRRSEQLNADLRKLQSFLGSEEQIAELCTCLTEVEYQYTEYVRDEADELTSREKRARIRLLRSFIKHARRGFDLVSYARFMEGRAHILALALRDLQSDYMLFLIGDPSFRGNARTGVLMGMFDKLIEVLGDEDDEDED